MNIHRFTLLAALLTSPAFAQTNTFPNSGNVGIGTTTPQYKLQVVANNPTGDNWLGAFSPGVDVNGNRMELILGYHGAGADDFAFIQGHHEGVRWSPLILQRYDGNVGIGTTSPQQKLAVNGYIDAQGFLPTTNFLIRTNPNDTQTFQTQGSLGKWVFTNNDGGGFLGIGTTSPATKLDVFGPSASDISWVASLVNPYTGGTVGQGSGIKLQMDRAAAWWGDKKWAGLAGVAEAAWSDKMALVIYTQGNIGASPGNQPTEKMRVTGEGNVGIGTANPTHKLAVNGTIKAKEVIVETSGWSDYVFADNYKLAPLSEVEAHIKANKHLPGIPSAAQVAENGVSLGDVQAALLAKIEEITLHQIAQQKELVSLKAENASLKSRVQQLEIR
jgi:hypothetical protein